MATYCKVDDVMRACGLDLNALPKPMVESDIKANIDDAEAVIDGMTNTTYKQSQVTETYDGSGDDTLLLNNYPIITLDSLTINGTSVTTSYVAVYTGIEGGGKIVLKNTAEKNTFDDTGLQLVSVTYTYGFTSVPNMIKRATMNIAARMSLAQQVGGTYDDLSSFSVGEFSGTIGQAYINIREAFNMLKEEWKQLRPHIRILPAVA